MRFGVWVSVALCLAVCQVAAYTYDNEGRAVPTPEELDIMLPKNKRRTLQETILEARWTEDVKSALTRRWNPSGSYAPSNVACPPLPEGSNYQGYIRNALNNEIGPQEQDYLTRHRNQTRSGWQDWLSRAQLDGNGGIDGGVEQFLSQHQPIVGFAVSGGGYRAMLHGMGVAQGFDGRNDTANQRGVGGLLQLADYFAGLSGGSWCTGSMAINNWATAQDMLAYLNLKENLVLPEDGKTKLYIDLFRDTDDKKDAGYPTAITDFWGRALSYHLLNRSTFPNEGQATTFSDIVNATNFKNAAYPFPIALAIGRQPKEVMINPNATYFEWNPYEFGSWQPEFEAFVPTGYVGTNLNNGEVASQDKTCVAGFENFGFVVGSSSTLFNAAYLQLLNSNSTKISSDIIKSVLSDLMHEQNDVAEVPNPFKGYSPNGNGDNNHFLSEDYVDLVDGGEANQNIPFEPLIQPARNLDLILAVDGSGDTSNWPNGSSLMETEKRMNMSMFSSVKFPRVPDMNTMVNQGLNTRPTFFGCQEQGTNVNNTPPIVVYLPSYPYSYFSNKSTYQLEYDNDDAQLFVDNSVNVSTMGGAMDDWHTCLACAIVQRGLLRTNKAFPEKCQTCYSKYCWNGEYNTTKPGNYTPPIGLPAFITSNGSELTEPPVTGSNESAGSAIDSFFGDGAAGLTEGIPRTLALAALTTITAAFALL
ncbi:lysophospholipase [Malassezia furfur]|uniref:Lysophospholipase n=1 Tax=Malassezia furfur TaxID=55194 RepID=A0ABY8EPJ1_MALFU|nr:hypothetical protein CBS14141_000063 [Malassezia furfur]WFD47500.1 lysophospholipase [Malassezia furfur]